MIALILASAALAASGGAFLLALVKSKGLYDEHLEAAQGEDLAFKDLVPVGLWLNEKVDTRKLMPAPLYKRLHKHEALVRSLVTELHGAKYADWHLMMHKGSRTATSLAVAAGLALLALVMGGQGDAGNCAMFAGASVIAFVAMQLLVDKSLKDKIEKRRLALQMEFPDFINKLTLLVNAGMTISKAWEKIVTDNKKDTPLYREMSVALAEIRSGKPEAVAYEEFGRRCKVKEIIKFVSVIVLNLKKGGAEVVPTLKLQGMECWEMRKNVAKRLGEEATSKLMLPMAIMLVGVIMVVVLPAIMQLTNM